MPKHSKKSNFLLIFLLVVVLCLTTLLLQIIRLTNKNEDIPTAVATNAIKTPYKLGISRVHNTPTTMNLFTSKHTPVMYVTSNSLSSMHTPVMHVMTADLLTSMHTPTMYVTTTDLLTSMHTPAMYATMNSLTHTLYTNTTVATAVIHTDTINSTIINTDIIPLSNCNTTSNPTTLKLLKKKLATKQQTFPNWIDILCPEVKHHFQLFPYFNDFDNEIPVSTTLYASCGVCLLKLANQIASMINTDLLLFAGAHLGAVLHGGPIPWDDDIDALIPRSRMKDYYEKCNEIGSTFHKDIQIKCVFGFNAIKLYGSSYYFKTKYNWTSPFIDIFTFTTDGVTVNEVQPKSGATTNKFEYDLFYPSEPYYFGGIQLLGPRKELAEHRYKFDKCIVALFNHRTELTSTFKGDKEINCCEMSKILPFNYNGTIFNGENYKEINLMQRETYNQQPTFD